MIPAFVNERAGTKQQAADALKRVGGFEVHTVSPARLRDALEKAISGARRIVVAGGDGTIATAASVIRHHESETELAIIPGGTLNHFAKDHNIPTNLEDAAHTAANGTVSRTDVAFAGDQLFLNSSSVGAYVTYVRLRDRLEHYVGYHVASFVAAIRLFFVLRSVHVELEVDGQFRRYDTPLVFIGVGERELTAPILGNRVKGGERTLHVLVVRERRAARLIAVALAAITRGLKQVAQTPEVDSFLVDRCSISVPKGRRVPRVAIDGEIVRMRTPIEYRIERDALTIIVP